MESLRYVCRNVLRNRTRSLLTALSVAFSLALLTVLQGFVATQGVWKGEAERSSRIVSMSLEGFNGTVPIASVETVRRLDGIAGAVPYNWYGGSYRDERMPFAQFATDPAQAFQVWDDYAIDPGQLAAWQQDRQGCVADRQLAERRGWRIGERIPLKGSRFSFDLELRLCGVFDAPRDTDSLWFHWAYLEEGLLQKRAFRTGNAGTIFAKVAGSTRVADVIRTIDATFASSQAPTYTQTEAAFAQVFTDMLGNIRTFIRNIGLAVVFSLSLVAANGMAMSMRERTTEIALLKALGFPRSRILGMVLGESCLIALLGGVVGVGAGCISIELLHRVSTQLFPFRFTSLIGVWLGGLLTVAVGIGLASGLVPAVRAARLSVVDGLRRVV